MSDDGKVVTFKPLQASGIATDPDEDLRGLVQNLMIYCERLEEGMKHVSQVLVGLDSRLRRLELAHNKAEREKVTKVAIYNPQGQKVS